MKLSSLSSFLPREEESFDDFLKRVEKLKAFQKNPFSFFAEKKMEAPFPLQERVSEYEWDWAKQFLREKFDFIPSFLPAFYSNKTLFFWQGAQIWIFEKEGCYLLQIRKRFKKGRLLFYSKEEVLSHEAVHAFRFDRKESFFDEIFAYLSSPYFFRRVFGPLLQKNSEVFMLSLFAFSPFFLFAFSPLMGLFSLGGFFFLLGGFLFRLAHYHKIFQKAYKALEKITAKKNIFPILIRLEAKEIREIAKGKNLEKFFTEKKKKSLRWQIIEEAYFSKK